MVILLIATLVLLIVSDYRHRYVYTWQIALFAGTQLLYCFWALGKDILIRNMLINGIALLFLSFCVGIYVIIRFGKRGRPIGWGDILFVFALSPYFGLSAFLSFMVASMILSLGWWAVGYLKGWRTKEIPLISTLGICYGFLLIYDTVVAR